MKKGLLGLALLALCFTFATSSANAAVACSTLIAPPTDVNPGPPEGGAGNLANPNPTSITCDVGPLEFSNFAYKANSGTLDSLEINGCQGNVAGCSAAPFLNSYGITLDPNLTSPPTQDIGLIFEVHSAFLITQVTLINSGSPVASVQETVCDGAGLNGGPSAVGEINNGTCVNAALASFSGNSGTTQTITLSTPSNTIWIYKDVLVSGGGHLTNFQQDFTVSGVPEPATMFLSGAALCGLALIRRRAMKA